MYNFPKIILPFLFLLLVLTACESEKELPEAPIFSIENLPKTTFQFSSKQDTILIGKEGAIFHIPANGFVDEKGAVYKGLVEIELLEAFTLKDMILGNLTTVSEDGRLLESSGMFRFSIKGNGKTLTVNPAAKVMMTIPALNLKDDSQIFYANVDDDENLTWSLADSTAVDRSNQRLLLGRNLLLKECASCHNVNLVADMTGPALAWVTKRWKSMDDLIAFTRNSEGFAASGNLRARAMIQWAPSTMTAFENLSDAEIRAIYYYIDETARARNIDSTGQNEFTNIYDSSSKLNVEDSISSERMTAAFVKAYSLLYQISDVLNKSFNWVNIDRYVSTDALVQKDLRVKLNKETLDVYLTDVRIIFPNRNILLKAYQSQKEDYYSFTERYQLESTSFPIGEKAYLMATINTETEIYFALKLITIGDNNLETLDLKSISKEALIETIKATFK